MGPNQPHPGKGDFLKCSSCFFLFFLFFWNFISSNFLVLLCQVQFFMPRQLSTQNYVDWMDASFLGWRYDLDQVPNWVNFGFPFVSPLWPFMLAINGTPVSRFYNISSINWNWPFCLQCIFFFDQPTWTNNKDKQQGHCSFFFYLPSCPRCQTNILVWLLNNLYKDWPHFVTIGRLPSTDKNNLMASSGVSFIRMGLISLVRRFCPTPKLAGKQNWEFSMGGGLKKYT